MLALDDTKPLATLRKELRLRDVDRSGIWQFLVRINCNESAG